MDITQIDSNGDMDREFSDNRKQFPKIKGTYLNQLPIKRTAEIEAIIEGLVMDVLRLTEEQKDTNAIENQIDQYVYQLYRPTSEEIVIVDKFLNAQSK